MDNVTELSLNISTDFSSLVPRRACYSQFGHTVFLINDNHTAMMLKTYTIAIYSM